jgi:hypothetical protein
VYILLFRKKINKKFKLFIDYRDSHDEDNELILQLFEENRITFEVYDIGNIDFEIKKVKEKMNKAKEIILSNPSPKLAILNEILLILEKVKKNIEDEIKCNTDIQLNYNEKYMSSVKNNKCFVYKNKIHNFDDFSSFFEEELSNRLDSLFSKEDNNFCEICNEKMEPSFVCLKKCMSCLMYSSQINSNNTSNANSNNSTSHKDKNLFGIKDNFDCSNNKSVNKKLNSNDDEENLYGNFITKLSLKKVDTVRINNDYYNNDNNSSFQNKINMANDFYTLHEFSNCKNFNDHEMNQDQVNVNEYNYRTNSNHNINININHCRSNTKNIENELSQFHNLKALTLSKNQNENDLFKSFGFK